MDLSTLSPISRLEQSHPLVHIGLLLLCGYARTINAMIKWETVISSIYTQRGNIGVSMTGRSMPQAHCHEAPAAITTW